ncbi:MAG: DDE-type integrase/transposase/recombinase, partial [Cyclobacteriaceae bacterium]|nr:DDE-type integrase/transposase/recombinase [Cyclobacteriaceae bacterium]
NIKRLLTAPEFKHWPIVSLCYYAIRKGLLSASPATWYKYNKLLGIRKHAFKRRNPYRKGLKATYPNQYWHADITIFKTLDNVKHYIYLVVDNFSRKILSWEMAGRVCGETRMQTLKEAWIMTKPEKQVELIVDGGPENNNHTIDRFISSTEVDMKKSVALKDIVFSNSMVEAANKLLKYRYLFSGNIEDGDQLKTVLEKSIYDFNEVRPHGKLGGLTPSEAYQGQNVPISFDPEALRTRIKENRGNTGCTKCEI